MVALYGNNVRILFGECIMFKINSTENREQRYHLSDIFFNQLQITVRLVDLETGQDDIIGIDEHDKLAQLYPQFRNEQDVAAIKCLQLLNG